MVICRRAHEGPLLPIKRRAPQGPPARQKSCAFGVGLTSTPAVMSLYFRGFSYLTPESFIMKRSDPWPLTSGPQRSQNSFRTANAHGEGVQDAENIQVRSNLLLISRSGFHLHHHPSLWCRHLSISQIRFNELFPSLSRNVLAVEKGWYMEKHASRTFCRY